MYAVERGWSVDVITLDPADLRADFSRLNELPDGVRIFGVVSPKIVLQRAERVLVPVLRSIRKLTAKRDSRLPSCRAVQASASGSSVVYREDIRWSLAAPADYARAYHVYCEFAKEKAWSRAAAALAQVIARESTHDAIITCGPPHMVHEAGWRVARSIGLPFILDMRDPWSMVRGLPQSIASPLWLRLAAANERIAFERASLIIANTVPLNEAICAAYPHLSERVITVMNGYDEERLPTSRPTSCFTIAYAGSIYIDRDPRNLFRAAGRFVREIDARPETFRIEFIGNAEEYGGSAISTIAKEEGLEDFVRVGPSRPRVEAMEFLAQATMLLSLPQGIPLAIPSKIFEYMQFDAWLLALAKRGSGVEMLLRGTGADVVDPDDTEGILTVLRQRYAQHLRGERPSRIVRDERYSRRTQASILFDALERCVDQNSSHSLSNSVTDARQ